MSDAWGSLEPGPYAVGFRTALGADPSRRYGDRPRPILQATWYPAATHGAAPLLYGDYLTIPGDDPHLTRLSAYHRDITLQYGLGDAPTSEALERRLRLPMRAVRDAAPAPGRFPTVVYHPGLGGSYEDNGVLCEFLASRGYVVVSSAYSPEDAGSLQIDGDLDRSRHDLDFLCRALNADPQADVSRIGGVGHSFGAQALLAWSSEKDSPVRAVVSLDSTLDYDADNHSGFAALRQRLARVENIAAAWLLVAVAERAPHWSQWDAPARNLLWMAETAPLGHDDFTAQSLLGTVDRCPDPAEAAGIRSRYDAVCRLTRRFLDAYVVADESARRALTTDADPSIALRRRA